jgi:hypothetical protein
MCEWEDSSRRNTSFNWSEVYFIKKKKKKSGVLYNAWKLVTTVIRMEKHCMARDISKERAASLSVGRGTEVIRQ